MVLFGVKMNGLQTIGKAIWFKDSCKSKYCWEFLVEAALEKFFVLF
jgi:hypothetical protein